MARLPRHRGQNSWEAELKWPDQKHSPFLRTSSPLSLSHLDMWDKRSHFKAQSSSWSVEGGLSGSTFFSVPSTRSSLSERTMSQEASVGVRRWHSLSHLAPDGASRALSLSPGAELRAALAEGGARQAALVQRLREAHGRLNVQTEVLKARGTQLRHSWSSTQLLELRHKQLAEAVSALEQEKDTAEMCRLEESRRHGELSDKVLQLELEMLKMRMALEKERTVPLTVSPLQASRGVAADSPLSQTVTTAKEGLIRQGKQQVEKDLQEVRSALRETQGRAEALQAERDEALQQLRSCEQSQLAMLTQLEGAKQRLSESARVESDLQGQLSEAQSQLDQAILEKDLVSLKLLRLEDTVVDHKVRLTGALADKDRLIQEKADLHQRTQGLELQLDRAEQGRKGFTEQLSELSSQLVDTKEQASRKDQAIVKRKEELFSAKQLNERLSVELAELKQSLELVSTQLRCLEAERLSHTSQITALETERLKLIEEKKELLAAVQQGRQEEVTELRERCQELIKSQEGLHQENQKLRSQCRSLEAGMQEKEVELQKKGEEHKQTEAKRSKEAEELQKKGSHWKERWQEVLKALQSSKVELDKLRQQQRSVDTLKEQVEQLNQEVEILKGEVETHQTEIQTLLQQKADMEAELQKVKREGGALGRVELDACRQQLDLERSRSQILLQKLKSSCGAVPGQRVTGLPHSLIEADANSPETGQAARLWAVQTQDRGMETDPAHTSDHTDNQSDRTWTVREAPVPQRDSEFSQVRVELQKVQDVLQLRDSEVQEQQRELQCVRGQLSEKSSKVQRLERQLREKQQELEQKEGALKGLERLRDAEQTEARIHISSLQLKAEELKEQAGWDIQRAGVVLCPKCSNQEPATVEELRSPDNCKVDKRENTRLETDGSPTDQALLTEQDSQGRASPETKREIRPKYIDHDNQRRLVTEQLKSLFKEREQLGWVYEASTRALRERCSSQDRASKSKLIKNAIATLQNQKTEEQNLLQDRERRQVAPKCKKGQEDAGLRRPVKQD